VVVERGAISVSSAADTAAIEMIGIDGLVAVVSLATLTPPLANGGSRSARRAGFPAGTPGSGRRRTVPDRAAGTGHDLAGDAKRRG